MYRRFLKPLGLFALLAFAGLFTSCQKEDTITGVDNFVLQSTLAIETRAGAGMTGCYELVFPVTIQFSDGTTVEVGDYAALKQAIRDWFIATGGHPNLVNRPKLVLPFQVINQAGEIITVETPEALKDLIALCRPLFGGGHHGGGPDSLGGPGGPCFTLVFPLTISFPDGLQVTVNTPKELARATFRWNMHHPRHPALPQFVFPITVTLRDGTQVVVNSKEDLRAIKDDCRG